MAHSGPKDAAMFSNREPSFPTCFFFSPGAARIAKKVIDDYAGTECAAPSRDELTLFAGTAASFDPDNIPFADSK